MDEKKKILCLSCSPSKGRNSDSMLDAFIGGMETIEDVEIYKVYLNDIHIEHYNFENSTGPLPEEKEFAELVERMKESDGLVVATPTYNFSVPAQLKNFLDRIRCFALDFENKTRFGQPKGKLSHIKPYFLVSGGTPVWFEKLFFFGYPPFWLRAVFLYHGTQYADAIYSGDIETFKNKTVLQKCERAGKKYAHMLARGKSGGILSRIFVRPPQSE